MSHIGPHLLGIEGMSRSQIDFALDTAKEFVEVSQRNVKKVPTLRGKTVINMFLEDSTRTRSSFELAAKRLSADTINLTAKGSSINKGETLLDTAITLQSMAPDVVVIRHAAVGAPHFLAKHLKSTAVINAGDGLHEHPTQALLDALTIRQRLGRLTNLKIVLVGDILRARVARSNFFLHKAYGNEIRIVAPPTLARQEFKALGVKVFYDMPSALEGADVVMSLRMKHEYLKDFFVPNLEEYSRRYLITENLLAKYAPDSILLAPGPFVRGIEVASDVIDGPRSCYTQQVRNGVAVRMAMLFLLGVGKSKENAIQEKLSGADNEEGTKS